MTFKETVVRGTISSEHLVQLFDTTDSLAETVAEFLAAGVVEGQRLLVVAMPDHWSAIASAMRAAGVDADAATASGQLTRLDAADTLRLFMRRGRPDRDRFDASVGRLVRELASHGQPLRIYGEMVNLLATEANMDGALQLEELWNALAETCAFTLFCGYSAVNFGDPRSAEALRRICQSHSHVRTHPRDPLGSFLTDTHHIQAPGA
jgi:hypothetical protein